MMKKSEDLIDKIVSDWQKLDESIDTKGTEVIGHIVRLASLISRKVDDNLAKYDLSVGEFDVLAALLRSDNQQLAPGQLQNLILISSGGLSNRIKRLEKHGYIERFPDKEDGRGVIVALTDSGKTLIEEAAPSHLMLEKTMIQSLKKSEAEALQQLLHQLLIHLDDH